jgi:hypothetical protein
MSDERRSSDRRTDPDFTFTAVFLIFFHTSHHISLFHKLNIILKKSSDYLILIFQYTDELQQYEWIS